MTDPYRPSNGDEGRWFLDRWCKRCAKDRPHLGCPIVPATMALDVDHPDYPTEWIEDDDGPRCTAFVEARDD